MDPLTAASLAFIVVAVILVLPKALRWSFEAAAVMIAVFNDLCDLGLITLNVHPLLLDLLTALLLALAFRNRLSLVALLDVIPFIAPYPVATLAMLLSVYLRK